jgi:hypothetical protein
MKKQGRKPKYATEEERILAKRKQTLESNKKKRQQMKMKGDGIFSDISNAIKKTFHTAVRKTKNTISDIEKYKDVVLHGRDDYQPKVRKILSEYGDKMVKSAIVMRKPLSSLLMGALNTVSLGQFSKNLKNSPYDKLYHLALIVQLEDGTKLLIEKNEVINMEINPSMPSNAETLEVPNIPSNLIVNDMLIKTQERMGPDYFKYNSKHNNCQNYIINILHANNMGDEATYTFVKQNTKELFEGLTTLRKIANTVTDLGAKVNEITTGAGLKPKMKQNKISSISIMPKKMMKCEKCEMCGKGLYASGKGVMMQPTHTIIHCYDNMEGGSILGDLRRAFNPRQNGVSKAFEKAGNTIKSGFEDKIIKPAEQTFTPKLGKDITSGLIHQALPAVVSGLTGATVSTLTGNPILGSVAANTAGKIAGQKLGDTIGNATGYGVARKGRFVKGSPEAKKFMQELRMKKQK